MQSPAAADLGQSADELFTEVYGRLKALAAHQRIGTPAAPATTELVHELYLRMAGVGERRFDHPAQFFAYAARAMRHLLIDAARERNMMRHGGQQHHVSMTDPAAQALSIDPRQALQLDEALRALETDDARAARVVELHYFAGLGIERIAELLALTPRTIERDWRYARAYLAARVEA
jgi:RNA polymerase sigma factor (TIGR02999 family)